MSDSIPEEARPVARILLFDPEQRLLLFQAERVSDGYRFWVTPGGGLEAGETFEQAARRELWEETGQNIEIGGWVWTRRHRYPWNGLWCDQYERFFVARTVEHRIQPRRPDDYVVAHRWWSLPEIQSSSEDFAPRRLPDLLRDIACGNYPDPPIDCGI